MRRRARNTIVLTFALAVLLAGATVASGNAPRLGLDLQGGLSVVLQPTGPVENEDDLTTAIDIIRRRIDSLGVVEPEIQRFGDSIIVSVPGIDDPERAIELVGQTAELRFRPVLLCEAVSVELQPETGCPFLGGLDPVFPTTTATPPGDGTSTTAPTVTGATDGTAPSIETTPPTGATTTIGGVTTVPSGDAMAPGPGESAGGAPPATAVTDTGDTVPVGPQSSSTTTTTPSTTTLDPLAPTPIPVTTTTLPLFGGSLFDEPLTTRDGDVEEAVVLAASIDEDGNEQARYRLGPTAMTGEGLSGARPSLGGLSEWVVIPEVRRGTPGLDELNAVAVECFTGSPSCPTGQLAIVLDGVVVSAPNVRTDNFSEGIQITGAFTEGEARDLARVLQFGALPLELEVISVEAVSATIGADALQAGLIAGAVGLALAAFYMLAYYRLLGLVALLSLMLSGVLLWVIVSFLSASQGMTLTLAGVTGIIVSIGVSLDSNVVYFEHLKEDIRNGRTLRSSSERSFTTAFSTIVKADVASLIGAVILFFLSIGSVQGFALVLGLATVLDLVASYFFMRPAVILLAQWKKAERRPELLGLPAGADDVSRFESAGVV